MSLPKPWIIEDGEGGKRIRLVGPDDIAFVDVLVQGRYSWLKMTDLLPGAVGIVNHERTRTTWEGQPAIRFDREYLATSSGPLFRVEGLITKGPNHTYLVQCGVRVAPLDPPDPTPIKNENEVRWTPAIDQGTTRVVESFTFGT